MRQQVASEQSNSKNENANGDNLDQELYGDIEMDQNEIVTEDVTMEDLQQDEINAHPTEENVSSNVKSEIHWMFICYDNGTLEVTMGKIHHVD